ncbi:MAG: hypothetical protein ACTSUL_06260 [Promethearchaeota archaeon]
MNNKKKDSEDMHDLLIFKETEAPKESEIEKLPEETVLDDIKVKIFSDLKPIGRFYRYTLIFINNSQETIQNIKVTINFSKFLIIYRHSPPTLPLTNFKTDEGKQVIVFLNEINPKNSKKLSIFFSTKDVIDSGKVKVKLDIMKSLDILKELELNPVNIDFHPIAFEPKIIPTSQIGYFIKDPTNRKAIRSIGIDFSNKENFEKVFPLMQEMIKAQNFQLLSVDENRKISWYFGTELVSGADVLMIGRIIENKIEYFAISKNPDILVSLIAYISKSFINRLILNQMIKSEDEVIDLECKYCGYVLPYFPNKNDPIKCSKCGIEQVIW